MSLKLVVGERIFSPYISAYYEGKRIEAPLEFDLLTATAKVHVKVDGLFQHGQYEEVPIDTLRLNDRVKPHIANFWAQYATEYAPRTKVRLEM